MKSIKEKAEEYGYANWQSDEYHDGASEDLDFDPIGHTQKTFEAGVNYALDAIEEFMDNIYFGSNAAKMFYKDLKANIYKFIEQLKGNQ